jgi:hypothetical protein
MGRQTMIQFNTPRIQYKRGKPIMSNSTKVQYLLLVLALSWAADQQISFAAEPHSADGPATHNMLVVGERAVYLSHLPMFQEEGEPPMPHRYQVILEVTLMKQGSDPHHDYLEDRQKHPTTKIYTLNPAAFVLPSLVSTGLQQKPLRSFKGKTIFRGHLERDDKIPILNAVEVNVQQVVHFREFDPKTNKSPRLEYLFFGKGRELFLAHLITKVPDFDQMLSVKATDLRLTDEMLAKGVHVIFPGTTNAPATRLKAKQTIIGELKVKDAPVPKEIQVEVDAELYFEEGELRLPPVFETTPEEKLAGFP